MECPICNAELTHEDTWGYLAAHQSGEIMGQIYRCPNHEGFDSEEEASEYLKETNQTLEDLDCETWEELTCDSSMHHVSGSFYTDKQDNLHEGYPC
ncbi:MAG: hypothetical protein GY928_14595 [Colwellia sp.]|nr:hypothetical protein [Colwellia sp.]